MQQHFHYVSMNHSAIFFIFSCVYTLKSMYIRECLWWVDTFSRVFTFFNCFFPHLSTSTLDIASSQKRILCFTCFSDSSLNSMDRNHFLLKIARDFDVVSPTSFKSSLSTTGHIFGLEMTIIFFLIDNLIACDTKN